MLRGEAFDAALAEFCAGEEPERLRLLATYGGGGLRRMLTGVYETLRSAGRALELELGEPADLPARVEELREAARCLADEADATERQRAKARRGARPAGARAARGAAARPLRPPRFRRARRELRGGAQAGRAGGARARAARDRDLLQELLERFDAAYAAAKARESALDFEDLQLAARDLLRDRPEIRERESLRFRSLMVDEFQDTNALQCDLVDLLARRRHRASSSSATSSSRSTASGTQTSASSASAAPRRRRCSR